MGLPPSISTTRLLRGCSTLPYADVKINVLHVICRRVTQALLFRDFDIQLEIPDDRLCPPVPQQVGRNCLLQSTVSHLRTQPRLNYVLWLHDILSHTSSQERPPTSIRGIDVYSSNNFFWRCYIVTPSHTLQRDRRLCHLPTTCLPPLAQLSLHCNFSLLSLSTLPISVIRMAKCRYRIACVRSGKY